MQRRSRLEIESGGVWVRVPIKTVCLSAVGAMGLMMGPSAEYKEAATMLHPDKQHGRDEAARRRTATAWQRVSAAYGRVMAALGAADG